MELLYNKGSETYEIIGTSVETSRQPKAKITRAGGGDEEEVGKTMRKEIRKEAGSLVKPDVARRYAQRGI